MGAAFLCSVVPTPTGENGLGKRCKCALHAEATPILIAAKYVGTSLCFGELWIAFPFGSIDEEVKWGKTTRGFVLPERRTRRNTAAPR